MISGRWAIEGSEVDQSFDVINEKPLFIDRNPNRFGFVLDFLRDGKVNLPHTTTAEEMAIDFDYLNIDVPKEAIAFHPLPASLVVSKVCKDSQDAEFIRLKDAVGKDGFLKHVEETLESFGIRSTISSGYYSWLNIKLI